MMPYFVNKLRQSLQTYILCNPMENLIAREKKSYNQFMYFPGDFITLIRPAVNIK